MITGGCTSCDMAEKDMDGTLNQSLRGNHLAKPGIDTFIIRTGLKVENGF